MAHNQRSFKCTRKGVVVVLKLECTQGHEVSWSSRSPAEWLDSARNQDWLELVGDGRCDSPGFSATLMDEKIIK